MTSDVSPTKSLTVTFGAAVTAVQSVAEGFALHLAVPCLDGLRDEVILRAEGAILRVAGDFSVVESTSQVAGVAIVPSTEGLQLQVANLYRQVLALCEGKHLCRVWNYLPRINVAEQGLERYRQFNLGRWQAFEERFGADLTNHLSAASAVGAEGDHFALIFLADKSAVSYLENPHQVPAHRYPLQYGPRAPGFARAAVKTSGTDWQAWLSGTASIRGHETIGVGNLAQQLAVTWENITEMRHRMFNAAGLSPEQVGQVSSRLKAYLRHPQDLAQVQQFLEVQGVEEGMTTFLHADICRAELDVEVEGVFGEERSGQLLIDQLLDLEAKNS